MDLADLFYIDHPEALAAFLEEKPREWSVWIAHRAAMRVAPVAWRELRKNGNIGYKWPDLTLLRALLISGIGSIRNSPEIMESARDAFAHISLISKRTKGEVRDSVNAARAAVCAATNYGAPEGFAVSAVKYMAKVLGPDGIWEMVSKDCRTLQTDGADPTAKIWPSGRNPLQNVWQGLNSELGPSEVAGNCA